MREKMTTLQIATALMALLILSLQGAESAELSALEALQKAFEAEKNISFVGVQETTRPLGETIKVKVVQVKGQRYLEYLTTPFIGRTLIDYGDKICWLDPNAKLIHVIPTNAPLRSIRLLANNYQLELLELKGEKLLDRSVYLLSVQPKHPNSPSMKMWLDKKIWFPLRTNRYDASGKLQLSSFYTQVKFQSDLKDLKLNDEIFKLPNWEIVHHNSESNKSLTKQQIADAAGFDIIVPNYIVEGYELEGYYLSYCPMRMPIAQLRYFNGLNSFSLFEHPIGCRGMGGMDGMGGMGGMGMMGRNAGRSCCAPKSDQKVAFFTVKDGLMLSFVGDLPKEVFQRMAESLIK